MSANHKTSHGKWSSTIIEKFSNCDYISRGNESFSVCNLVSCTFCNLNDFCINLISKCHHCRNKQLCGKIRDIHCKVFGGYCKRDIIELVHLDSLLILCCVLHLNSSRFHKVLDCESSRLSDSNSIAYSCYKIIGIVSVNKTCHYCVLPKNHECFSCNHVHCDKSISHYLILPSVLALI